jgi:hypothetical protein
MYGYTVHVKRFCCRGERPPQDLILSGSPFRRRDGPSSAQKLACYMRPRVLIAPREPFATSPSYRAHPLNSRRFMLACNVFPHLTPNFAGTPGFQVLPEPFDSGSAKTSFDAFHSPRPHPTSPNSCVISRMRKAARQVLSNHILVQSLPRNPMESHPCAKTRGVGGPGCGLYLQPASKPFSPSRQPVRPPVLYCLASQMRDRND